MNAEIILLLLVAGYSAGGCINNTQCSLNEKYTKCGTLCQATCKNPNPGPCPDVCVKGCQCKKGYIRATDGGRCVSELVCAIYSNNTRCGLNEEYTKCGTLCEPTCKNPKPEVCADVCVVGCQCKKGFIRATEKGRCVSVEACAVVPQCREKNQIFSEYASRCSTTCQNRLSEQGCSCKPDYIFDEISGNCVKLDECPSDKYNFVQTVY